MSAELNVQLRLLQDNVQSDAKRAAETARRVMTSATYGSDEGQSGIKRVIKEGNNAAIEQRRIEKQINLEIKERARILKEIERDQNRANKEAGGGQTSRQSISDGFRQMVMSYIRFKVFSAAIDQLRKAVANLTEAIAKAHARYAGAATSGFGVSTFTRRNAIAGILGVSPDDVFRFGSAFKFVGDKMKHSLDIIAQGTRPLAELNMSFEMLKVDLEAMFVSIALKLKPSLESIITGLDKIVNVFTRFSGVIAEISKHFARMTGFGITLGGLNLLGGGKAMSEGMPGLSAQAKQLPASSWEKMGLVVGGNVATNYLRQIAQNTAVMAANALGAGSGAGSGVRGNPNLGMPRIYQSMPSCI